MQSAFERKKEGIKKMEPAPLPKKAHERKPAVSPFDHAQIIAPQAKKAACQVLSPSMSEGPMLLNSIDESKKVESSGRASFEKSVKIELDSLKGRKKRKRKGKARAKRRKGDSQKPPKR